MALLDFIFKKPPSAPPPPRGGFFSTEADPRAADEIRLDEAERRAALFQQIMDVAPKFTPVNSDGTPATNVGVPKFAMDASNGQGGDSVKWQQNLANGMPFAQLAWFANQTFIGYQAAAMLAQNWLVNKCCTVAPRDAIRNGYEITVNNGVKANPEVLAKVRQFDKEFGVKRNTVQYIRYGLIFGIRVARFIVEGLSDEDLAKPFNIDGVRKGSYKGIAQIDPYWITPELDLKAGSDPGTIHFYEPTWWRINGKRIHRTHLIIYRPYDVADILKPVYWYGGIPLPQLIAERVYAAERIANEAPMLALSKRTKVIQTDAAQALANQAKFDERMRINAAMADNYGTQIIDRNDTAQQFDTALGDFDALIMTQYQLVSAAAEYPASKLLEISPKGFNATGEFEERSYHERLESMQEHDMMPLLDRHYLLLSKSEGLPLIEVQFKPVDFPTGKNLAEINFIKSQTAVNESQIGGIDGQDERERLTADPDSGYNGLTKREIEEPLEPSEEDENGAEPLKDEQTGEQ